STLTLHDALPILYCRAVRRGDACGFDAGATPAFSVAREVPGSATAPRLPSPMFLMKVRRPVFLFMGVGLVRKSKKQKKPLETVLYPEFLPMPQPLRTVLVGFRCPVLYL